MEHKSGWTRTLTWVCWNTHDPEEVGERGCGDNPEWLSWLRKWARHIRWLMGVSGPAELWVGNGNFIPSFPGEWGNRTRSCAAGWALTSKISDACGIWLIQFRVRPADPCLLVTWFQIKMARLFLYFHRPLTAYSHFGFRSHGTRGKSEWRGGPKINLKYYCQYRGAVSIPTYTVGTDCSN